MDSIKIDKAYLVNLITWVEKIWTWWLIYDDKLKLPKYACKHTRVTTKTLEIQSLFSKPVHKIGK